MPDAHATAGAPARAGEPSMTPVKTFTCQICGEPSTRICAYCTKDTCDNHLCVRCRRCSDCCTCEVPLEPEPPAAAH
jgi:hypothetical protein